MEKIDFVIPWVDGADPVWRAEKKEYEKARVDVDGELDDANDETRYRDLGFLR